MAGGWLYWSKSVNFFLITPRKLLCIPFTLNTSHTIPSHSPTSSQCVHHTRVMVGGSTAMMLVSRRTCFPPWWWPHANPFKQSRVHERRLAPMINGRRDVYISLSPRLSLYLCISQSVSIPLSTSNPPWSLCVQQQ